MKKLVCFVMLMLGSLSMSAADVVTAKVQGSSLNIGLENETSFVAFQMDVKLPEGISATAVEAVANRLSQEGSDTEVGGTKFIIAYNTLEGNVLRVIAYNLANAAINNANGDILKITLNANVADATAITVSNIKFVKASDLAEMDLENAVGENGAMRGDVDGNGKVNISDVVEVIKIIKADGYQSNADIDGNSKVNISDVVEIIKIIKG